MLVTKISPQTKRGSQHGADYDLYRKLQVIKWWIFIEAEGTLFQFDIHKGVTAHEHVSDLHAMNEDIHGRLKRTTHDF